MFDCSICRKSFEFPKQLVKHNEFFYGYTKSPSYRCTINNCFRSLTSKNDYIKHLYNFHKEKNLSDIVCEVHSIENDKNLNCDKNLSDIVRGTDSITMMQS